MTVTKPQPPQLAAGQDANKTTERTQFKEWYSKRIKEGTAASAKAAESAARTVPLAKASWSFAQKAGAS